jgi:hypothetical protein
VDSNLAGDEGKSTLSEGERIRARRPDRALAAAHRTLVTRAYPREKAPAFFRLKKKAPGCGSGGLL